MNVRSSDVDYHSLWAEESLHRLHQLYRLKRDDNRVRKEDFPLHRLRKNTAMRSIIPTEEVSASENATGIKSSSLQVVKHSISKSKVAKFVDIQVKHIPGLQKTIEKNIELWRKGNTEACLVPLRCFLSVAGRKRLCPEYRDKTWASSGQKDSFRRHRDLAELVGSVPDGTFLNIREEGSDEEWKRAVEKYHEKWDENGKPKALSTVVVEYRKFKGNSMSQKVVSPVINADERCEAT